MKELNILFVLTVLQVSNFHTNEILFKLTVDLRFLLHSSSLFSSVFSITVVCFTKATSPASATHLSIT